MCGRNCGCGCAAGSTLCPVLFCIEDNDGDFTVQLNSGSSLNFSSLLGFDDCSVTGLQTTTGNIINVALSGVADISIPTTNDDAFDCFSARFDDD
jgi:hypothetical protein